VVGYVAYLVLSRYFLSPLAKVPGPILALSSWYECYYGMAFFNISDEGKTSNIISDVFQPAQYVFKIKEMHAKYGRYIPGQGIGKALTFSGPVVRIGPSDVSISDPDFVDNIYAPGPGHKRDKDHTKVKALGVDSSVGASIAHELHRKRREVLNPFFSYQRIIRFDPELINKANQLESIFAKAGESGEVINLSDIYFGFSNE
jgi:hypothetical protein